MSTTIYNTEDGFKLLHDADDPILPLGVEHPNAEDDPWWLSKDEALAAAASIFAQYGAAVPQAVNNVVTTPAAVFEEHGDERESWNHTALSAAAKHGRVVEFGYAKGGGQIIEQRRLEPDQVIQNRTGGWLVVGQDPDRGEVRAFRLDRITGFVSVA